MYWIQLGIYCAGAAWVLYLAVDGIRDYKEYRKARRRELYKVAEKAGRERMCGLGRRS